MMHGFSFDIIRTTTTTTHLHETIPLTLCVRVCVCLIIIRIEMFICVWYFFRFVNRKHLLLQLLKHHPHLNGVIKISGKSLCFLFVSCKSKHVLYLFPTSSSVRFLLVIHSLLLFICSFSFLSLSLSLYIDVYRLVLLIIPFLWFSSW